MHIRVNMRPLCFAALVLLFAIIPVFAQTSFGRVSGTVTDSSGAAISGAKVSIQNQDTQNTRTASTDANGFYVVTNLPIGPYSVKIEQSGFKQQSRTGLGLVADGRLTVDFQLEIGSLSESVEVKGSTETLNTTSGEIARVVDTKQVQNLALNGRNYIQLLTLIPGSAVTNPDQFSVTTSLSATNSVVNGNRGDSSNLTVDGAFNLVAGSNGSLMNNVGPDFIQEVKVQTSNFSAEYGRMSGAAFNIVTKNGTNEFHGSAFEYFRNDALDARNFFAPQKTKLRFNDFGYSFGGPIKKDKLFFFVGEEWKRLRQVATPTRVSVPSTAQLNGYFGGTTINEPGTKTPIPNNDISSRITPNGQAIANVYKRMIASGLSYTDAAVGNNLTLAPDNPLNFREDIVRLDYRINDKHSIYGRWIQDENVLIDPFGTFSGSNLPTTPTERSRPGRSFLVAHTWLISPSIVNEARANASWASQNIPPYGDTWQRDTYGFNFPQLFAGGPYDNGIPNVDISGFANFRGPSFALHSPTTDIQFTDNISFIRGAHVLKFGFAYFRDRIDQNGRPGYTGALNFNASSGNPNTSGNSFADALLGNFLTYSEASADPMGFFRFSQYEAFVQDSWRVSNRLSLELGIRYQYGVPLYTQANNMANFVPNLYNPAQAVTVTPQGRVIPGSGNPYNGLIQAGNGVPSDEAGRVPGAGGPLFQAIPTGAPRGLYSSENDWAPRLGLAYTVNPKTVIRGGYGIFYNRPQGNLTFSQVNLPPFLQVAQVENGNLENPGGATGVSAPLDTVGAISPKLRNSYSQQFSLTISRELPMHFQLETSYVGNLARKLSRQPDINFPSLDAQNFWLTLPSNQRSINYVRPYQGYSSINQYMSDATSNYHALQVYVSKRTGPLQLTGSYTWSKSLTDASDQGYRAENYLDRHYSYGPSTFDRRHAFVATFVWALPALNNHKAVIRSIAGGWQASGIIRLQSGPYLTITGNNSFANNLRADYVGGPVLTSGDASDINNWINKSAFAVVSPGHYGSSGVGIVQAPGLQSYDFSAAKYFALTERFNLKFQADFFNAFNIANFNNLGTNVSNASFGTLASAYPGRNLQLALKLTF